jgi:prepilin-type N-terminal cleavage/methylation domain-containing protein
MRRGAQGGFTIIEIMIVTMIIGVLASLLLPQARQYSAQAKVTEAIMAFNLCKNSVAEVYQSVGESPGLGNWGCENETGPVSHYVGTVTTTAEGIIKVGIRGTGDGRLENQDITLEPLDATGALMTDGAGPVRRWRCGRIGSGLTTLDAKYLPSSCRGD